MSFLPSKKKVAVIGDELFVNGFRLAGVSKTYIINTKKDEGKSLKEKIGKLISELFEDSSYGIIIVQDWLREYVESFRRTSPYPLILYLPSAREVNKMNVKEYYNRLVRAYLGISLEV